MEREHIINLIRTFDKRENKNIILIINIQGKSVPIEGAAMLTEFYDTDETDQILAGMKKAGMTVHVFTNETDFLKKVLSEDANALISFNLGRNGVGLTKKSLIPMICSAANLSYTGSDAYVTALCRNKFHYTMLLECLGIQIPRTEFYYQGFTYNTRNKLMPEDIVLIKPAYEAASRGVFSESICQYVDYQKITSRITQLARAFSGTPILVQEFIKGFEIEVPIFVIKGKAEALMSVGLSINNKRFIGDKILDYERSALYDYGFYDYSDENPELAAKLMQQAENVARCLGLKGYGRVDFRVDANGKFYVIDISTHPFIMEHSSFAFAFRKIGIEYANLFKCIVECSLDECCNSIKAQTSTVNLK